jgi:hypothetical protein
MKQAVRVIVANIVVFGFLIFAVDAALILRHQINKKLATGPDQRADLVNYADDPQARHHFAEILALPSSYESFVGWRRLPFQGQTVAIDENGLRQTSIRSTVMAHRPPSPSLAARRCGAPGWTINTPYLRYSWPPAPDSTR